MSTHQTGAVQAPLIPNQEREAKTKDEVGSANAGPQSEGARVNGAVKGTGEQSISEKEDKQDEHATREDKKPRPTSKTI